MKIIISVIQIKNIGGISTSVINLIHEVSKYHDVSLCVPSTYIYNRDLIPESVKLIKGSEIIRDCLVSRENLSFQTTSEKLLRSIRRVIRHIIGLENIIKIGLKEIIVNEEFDCAIAFSNNSYDKSGKLVIGGDYEFVLDRVNAKRKIAWIHNDITKCNITHDIGLKIFKEFDAIVNVSNDCKSIFEKVIPEYAYKSFKVFNFYNIEKIKCLSELNNDFDYSIKSIHFVTVGRVSNFQKRIYRIVNACKKLVSEGYSNFDWIIVGDGVDRQSLQMEVNENNLSDVVYFIGQKDNPYTYIKRADAFVLSSLYEGLPMTIREAEILGVPILTTEFGSAYEAVENGMQGAICENSSQGLYGLIKRVLDNPSELIRYRTYLLQHPISNERAMNEFEDIIKA